MAQSNRRALHAYVSDEAHEQWHGFAGEQGVSVSAILEVLGSRLLGTVSAAPALDSLDSLISDARRIDANRRRRKP